MKKFSTVLENAFKTTQLTRVKLRVDPANCMNGAILKYNGYEGYILAEDNGLLKVYLENDGAIITVPIHMIDTEMSITPLERLKLSCLKYLVQTKNLKREDPLTLMIASSPTPEAIEAFLREAGCTVDEILQCYKISQFANI